jgi:histidinol phosphatase-like PHP family hydrolase
MVARQLYVHNIDLHYHAGQERQPGTTLEGYLEHAVMTGRTVLGLTDHLEKYIGDPLSSAQKPPLYTQNVQGLQAYRADVDTMRERFPSLSLLFGPEIHAGPRIDILSLPRGVVDLSDYFLVSLPNKADENPADGNQSANLANTEAKISQVWAMAEMRERTGKPVYVCHPFRSAVNDRLVKRPIAPWVSALAPRSPDQFSKEQINRFFGFDVSALGRACAELDIPVEINGGTDGRIRALNLPAPLRMLWAAYQLMQQEGVRFVPGSDQHGYLRTPERREGRYIPFDAFEALGVQAEDVPLGQLGLS